MNRTVELSLDHPTPEQIRETILTGIDRLRAKVDSGEVNSVAMCWLGADPFGACTTLLIGGNVAAARIIHTIADEGLVCDCRAEVEPPCSLCVARDMIKTVCDALLMGQLEHDKRQAGRTN